MRDLTVQQFLDQLADRVPAPGGGASAALHAAQAAALLGMVARYSDGPRFADQEYVITRARDRADELRSVALDLAEQDVAAFAAVAAAYGLPKNAPEEKAARSGAITTALLGAAEPPARVIAVAGDLVSLAEQLAPVGNRNVITDVGAAADAARAAATTARLNVEINLGGIADRAARQGYLDIVGTVDEISGRADRVGAAVRKMLAE
jgi:formiminotetrahydrofolate cyclodeaminase